MDLQLLGDIEEYLPWFNIKLILDKSTICCINQKERTQKQTWHPYTLINLNATTAFGVILNWLP